MPVHVHVPVHAYLTVARATRELRVCREENTSIVWMQRRRKERKERGKTIQDEGPGVEFSLSCSSRNCVGCTGCKRTAPQL